MIFGTIGAGTIAQAIARHLIARGHEVILSNSRGPETLTDLIADLGPLASAGTVAQAAAADMVFLAVGWAAIPQALSDLPPWEGRILVDTSNQTVDLGAQTGTEWVATLAPGARVIKAFNTLYAKYIEDDPQHSAGRQVIFYAGDETAAKSTFHEVFDAIGFALVDIGPLPEGRTMQVGGGFLSALHVLRQRS